MIEKLKQRLKQRKGDVATETLGSFLVLMMVFASLILVLVYIMNYYTACYVCRRAVRSVEIAGQYVASDVNTLVHGVGGSGLSDLNVAISNVSYFQGTKIQLQSPFTITLKANFPIKIASFGNGPPVAINLPIQISMRGYSEVYWKTS